RLSPIENFPDSELLDLMAARCQGTATPEQWQRLSERIATDSAAAEYYVAHMTLHAGLSWIGDQPELQPQVVGRFSAVRQTLSVRPRMVMTGIVASLALIVLGVVGLYWNPFVQNRSVLAWVEPDEGEIGTRSVTGGDHVRQEKGITQMTFRQGVKLTLTGKADLELVDEKNVILHAGQIQVDVGPNGHGFTVNTPSAKVIDLGTVFGVSITDEAETNVVVFSGEVKLGPNRSPQATGASLIQGEAVRVHADGGHSLLREIWLEPDGSSWSTQKSMTTESPIVSVSDNRQDASCSKYYTIVPRGFGEDVLAYGDRPYEWNSLPGIPMPEELLGADYIRTFNNTKFEDPLEIVLTLSKPCHIYVLMDPRHEPPAWLTADFVKTDLQVGVDLGNRKGVNNSPPPPMGIRADRYLGRGPGMSVDAQFEVWKRTITQPQQVNLGPNGKRSEILLKSIEGAGSMYGIVVTPVH
ncbi:MAG TPA: FecR family protein, partial [Planctomicrobium sp.]|nr:FecR family protein [Planctomicrobium sp.]